MLIHDLNQSSVTARDGKARSIFAQTFHGQAYLQLRVRRHGLQTSDRTVLKVSFHMSSTRPPVWSSNHLTELKRM